MYGDIEQWFSPDHQLYVEKESVGCIWWKMLQKTEICNAGRGRYVPNLGRNNKAPDVPRQVRPREPISCTYGRKDARLHELIEVEVIETPERHPPPVFRKPDGGMVLYILHLFSGRRRKGDIHYWVMEMADDFLPWLRCHWIQRYMRSATWIMVPNWGNLLRLLEEDQKVFLQGAPRVLLAKPGLLRHIQPDAPGHWPRPLRSASLVWGLLALSCKELTLRQLHMGTRLYLHSMLAEFYVYSGGGSTF